ncbi:outer membrane protein assembly factor BamD [Thermaurantiacus sp.]
MTLSPRAGRSAILLGVAAALLLTPGCARNRNKAPEAAYIARDAETLYTLARTTLEQRNYKTAATMFDEVERQHPYSIWARRAQLMSAFSHYAARDYSAAILSAQRFLSLHPGNRDAPYAHYIIAMSYYEQIADVQRDQRVTQQAKDAMNELVRRYPNSAYAADARLKLDLINDHLAGKEMEIGRFYARNRHWIAASIRYRRVVDEFGTTSHVPEALFRLVEAYLALGIPEEAMRSAAVLGANFPGSKWYERSYRLMQQHAG